MIPRIRFSKNLPERIDVARYHSLIADIETVPEELKVISVDDNQEVMAVKHREKKRFMDYSFIRNRS